MFDTSAIIFSDSSEIDEYRPELHDLLAMVFDIPIGDSFVSDSSMLYDFVGTGDHGLSTDGCMCTTPDLWMDWCHKKIYVKFGVIPNGNDYLVDVCKQIREYRKQHSIGSGLN